MASAHDLSAPASVTLHLLDAALGHPVQTWRFVGKQAITIGRNTDNDVTIADVHVSRLHARLTEDEGEWTLVSLGRHGTLIHDRLVAETPLAHATAFRLGPSGPTLRFDCEATESRGSETIDSIQPDLLAALEIDEARKQAEVDEIVGNSLFRELKAQARKAKVAPAEDTQIS